MPKLVLCRRSLYFLKRSYSLKRINLVSPSYNDYSVVKFWIELSVLLCHLIEVLFRFRTEQVKSQFVIVLDIENIFLHDNSLCFSSSWFQPAVFANGFEVFASWIRQVGPIIPKNNQLWLFLIMKGIFCS